MQNQSKDIMKQLLEKCNINLNSDQLDRLWEYHILIQKRNRESNLTGISDFTEMVLKHYVDCIFISKLISIPFPLLDVGSGAGFPGIPLQIIFPEEKIILAESRKLRVRFLEEAKNVLHLKNITVFPKKITRNFDSKVKAVITRAVEPIPDTLKRISSCLENNGLAIFMKGPSVEKELIEIKRDFSNKYAIEKNESYTLPLLDHERRLVVLRRKA